MRAGEMGVGVHKAAQDMRGPMSMSVWGEAFVYWPCCTREARASRAIQRVRAFVVDLRVHGCAQTSLVSHVGAGVVWTTERCVECTSARRAKAKAPVF